ncbi:hypothetical protein VP1G_11301 [Cytospora mali]|uniref:Uncharacterized protein n=1 Tax=Cytospora mali TaxID=578113 RepID=A0A194VCQ8_CYTMA|nr:hypothetical protein VP1G_11301 [Valsa mali var. pyri (nom. inval.)]
MVTRSQVGATATTSSWRPCVTGLGEYQLRQAGLLSRREPLLILVKDSVRLAAVESVNAESYMRMH